MSQPGLLLLHGVGDSGHCMRPFVARVLASNPDLAGLDVVTPSANCHGGQPLTPGRTLARADQITAAVGHAQELAESTGGPIVLGGHSMGAAIALATAATRPDLIAALWLEDPPMLGSMADDDGAAGRVVDIRGFADWFGELQGLPLDEVIALARADHPQWDPAEFDPWARAKQSVCLDAFAEPIPFLDGWAADARSLTCPVTLAHGDAGRGAVVSPVAAAELAELAGWSVHGLPAGHDLRRDASGPAAALLADLIRSVRT